MSVSVQITFSFLADLKLVVALSKMATAIQNIKVYFGCSNTRYDLQ